MTRRLEMSVRIARQQMDAIVWNASTSEPTVVRVAPAQNRWQKERTRSVKIQWVSRSATFVYAQDIWTLVWDEVHEQGRRVV
jgi:hypothetical protein